MTEESVSNAGAALIVDVNTQPANKSLDTLEARMKNLGLGSFTQLGTGAQEAQQRIKNLEAEVRSLEDRLKGGGNGVRQAGQMYIKYSADVEQGRVTAQKALQGMTNDQVVELSKQQRHLREAAVQRKLLETRDFQTYKQRVDADRQALAEQTSMMAGFDQAKATYRKLEQTRDIQTYRNRVEADRLALAEQTSMMKGFEQARESFRKLTQNRDVQIYRARAQADRDALKEQQGMMAGMERARATYRAVVQRRDLEEYQLREAQARRLLDLERRYMEMNEKQRLQAALRAKRLMDGGWQGDLTSRFSSQTIALASTSTESQLKKQIDALATSQRGAAGSSKELHNAQQALHSVFRGVGGALGGLWLTYSKFIVVMGAAAAATKVMKDSIGRGLNADFQTQFASILQTKGPLDLGLKNELMRDLIDVSSRSVFSVTENAEAMKKLALAGVEASTSVKLLKTASDAAIFSQTSMAEATTRILDAVNNFALASSNPLIMASNFERVGNVMAIAASTVNASFTDIAKAFENVSGVAGTFKIEIEEAAVLLQSMARTGIRGPKAGTFLRNFLDEMLGAPNSLKAEKMFEKLGMDRFDPDNFMEGDKGVAQYIDKLIGKLRELDFVEQQNAIRAITNQRSRRLLRQELVETQSVLERTIELERQAATGSSTGKLAEMAESLSDNAKYAFQMAQAAYDAAVVSAFDGSQDTFKKIAEDLRDIFKSDWFRDLARDGVKAIAALAAELARLGRESTEADAKFSKFLEAANEGTKWWKFIKNNPIERLIRTGSLFDPEAPKKNLERLKGDLKNALDEMEEQFHERTRKFSEMAKNMAGPGASDQSITFAGLTLVSKELEETRALAVGVSKALDEMRGANPDPTKLEHYRNLLSKLQARITELEGRQDSLNRAFDSKAIRDALGDMAGGAKIASANYAELNEGLQESIQKLRLGEKGMHELAQEQKRMAISSLEAAIAFAQMDKVFAFGNPQWIAEIERNIESLRQKVKDLRENVALSDDEFNLKQNPPEKVKQEYDALIDRMQKYARSTEEATGAVAKLTEGQSLVLEVTKKYGTNLERLNDEEARAVSSLLERVSAAEELHAVLKGDNVDERVRKAKEEYELYRFGADRVKEMKYERDLLTATILQQAAAMAELRAIEEESNGGAADVVANLRKQAEERQRIANQFATAIAFEYSTDKDKPKPVASTRRQSFSEVNDVGKLADTEHRRAMAQVDLEKRLLELKRNAGIAQEAEYQKELDKLEDRSIQLAIERERKKQKAILEAIGKTKEQADREALQRRLQQSKEDLALAEEQAKLDTQFRIGRDSINREGDLRGFSKDLDELIKKRGEVFKDRQEQFRLEREIDPIIAEGMRAKLEVAKEYAAAERKLLTEIEAQTDQGSVYTTMLRMQHDALIQNRDAAMALAETNARVYEGFHRSPAAGFENVLKRLSDETTNLAQVMESGLGGSLDIARSAFEKLATTGKFSMRSMVADILTNLAKLAANQAFAQIMQLALSAAGSWFMNSSFMTQAPAPVSDATIRPVRHTGGMADYSGTTRMVSASVFNNAPRFHTGGITGDEVPIIARRGEGIFTPEQMKRLAPVEELKRGGNTTITNNNVSVVINEGQRQETASSGSTDSKELARQIESAVIGVLVREKRVGGILAT